MAYQGTAVTYTRAEEEALAGRLRSGCEPTCPRCGSAVERREVARPDGVPYVRRRVAFTCPRCRATLVLDARRMERPPDPSSEPGNTE